MKTFVLLAVVAIVRATVIPVVPAAVAVGETGESAQFRSEDNLGNYNFGYNEDHTSGGTFRREVGDAHGNVAGSYGLRDADGRVRIVNYIANDDGFKADIQTNEPGVEPKDPADATINKAESVILQSVVPAPVVAAPVPVAFPVSEPVLKTSSIQQVAVSEPISYSFPPVSSIPVAKSVATLTAAEVAPIAAVPLTKSSTTVTTSHVQPVTYTFPEPAAVPVAKSNLVAPYAVAHPAPLTVAQPAPIAVAQPAPVAYAFPARSAIPVAKQVATLASPAILGAQVAVQPSTRVAYSQVHVNNAPAHYGYNTVRYAPGALSYSAPLRYAVSPYGHLGAATHYSAPYYNSLYSPVVSSFAGPVPYFNNIAYPGYPVLKK